MIKRRFCLIDSYIFGELMAPFWFGTMGFVIIGMTDLLFSLVDLFINKGVPLAIVSKLLVYKIPAILVLFLPMAALFAVSLALIRLIKDSEITVLRTSGYSLGRTLVPVIVFGFFVSFLALFINEVIVPDANAISDKLLKKVSLKDTSPSIVANTFFKGGEREYFYVKSYDSEKGLMKNLMLYEVTGAFPRTLLAKQATWKDGKISLLDGKIYRYDHEGNISYQSRFEEMIIHLDMDLNRYFRSNKKNEQEMDSRELKERIASNKQSGIGIQSLEVALQLKRSIPFSGLVFVLLGAGIIVLLIRGRQDLWGIIFAILLALLSVGFYFFLLATCRSLGRSGLLNPFWGAWLPDIFFGVIASVILVREHFRR